MADESTNTGAAADEALSMAAAAAVAEQTETTETVPPAETEAPPQETAETKPEVDEEGLPVDHKERSELGRKLAALHRRNDEIDGRLSRIADLMERMAQPKEAPKEELQFDPNEPVTYAEMLKIIEQREQRKTAQQSEYNTRYSATIEKMVSEYVGEDGNPDIFEINGVLDEMKALTYHPSNDPEKDALANLRKAERAFLKKQASSVGKQRTNPLKGEPPKSPLGVATGGKNQVQTKVPVKLDDAAEAYLKFVSASDGVDRAAKLRAGIPANLD